MTDEFELYTKYINNENAKSYGTVTKITFKVHI